MRNFAKLLLMTVLMSGCVAVGQENSDKAAKPNDTSSWTNMSAETRKKMADMHGKMADCLKSNKPITECRNEMMASCPMMNGSCPMMGMMMGDRHHDDCMRGW